jgi:hypothetical protein
MDVRSALQSQYHAALAMLLQAIERCPDDIWTAGDHPRTYWRVAYHVLFCTHMYLQPSHDVFHPWERHREGCQFTDAMPRPPHLLPQVADPYTKQEVLDYWRACDAMVDESVDRLDLDALECGFWWYDMPKLDHQIMNIRHIQEHAAQLADRIRPAGGDVDWVGTVS